MTLSGVVLGIINAAIVVAILLLIGAIIVWFCRLVMKIEVDEQVQRLYIIVVGLIGLYMIVALLFGLPTVRVIGQAEQSPAVGGTVAAPADIAVPETLGRRINR